MLDKLRGYIIVIEKSRTGYGAYPPDLPGCGATGRTIEQTKRLLEEAILLHTRGLREDGLRVPRPRSLETLRRKRLVPAGTPRKI
jgi:predicted RNase H-like HicB family nuclease